MKDKEFFCICLKADLNFLNWISFQNLFYKHFLPFSSLEVSATPSEAVFLVMCDPSMN